MTRQDKRGLIYSIMWVFVAMLVTVALMIYAIWEKRYGYLGLIVLITSGCLTIFISDYLETWKEWKEENRIE